LVFVLSLFIGKWLETSLPHYGYALGVGMGLAFIIGVFTDISK